MEGFVAAGARAGDDDGDAALIVEAIVHNRHMMFKIAFHKFHQASVSMRMRRYQHRREMKTAVAFACQCALLRGYQGLLRLEPHAKRVKALRWRNTHLQTLTFGAWVRYTTSSCLDREDNLKATTFHVHACNTRGMRKFLSLVSRQQKTKAAWRLAEIFHNLLSYKRCLLRLRSLNRRFENSSGKTYPITEKSSVLQSFLAVKFRKSVSMCFTILRHKSNMKRRRSKIVFQSPLLTSLVRNAFDVIRQRQVDYIRHNNEEAQSSKYYLQRHRTVGLEKLQHFARSRYNRKEAFNQKFSYFVERSPKINHLAELCCRNDLLADVIVKRRFYHFVQRCKEARRKKCIQLADRERKDDYFLEKRMTAFLHTWTRHARKLKCLREFQDFQVTQYQRVRLLKISRCGLHYWHRSCREFRLRKAHMEESLKLHSIDWEFRRSLAVLGAWKRQITSTRRERRNQVSALRFWKHSRLCRVFALLRNRSGQDMVPPSPSSSGGSSALWRSGLGTIPSNSEAVSAQSQWGRRQFQPCVCILFYSLVSRSHRMVAENLWQSRRWVSVVDSLRAHAATSAHDRMQVHRGIWFWKFWREATALRRWKARMLHRRWRRDALRLAAVEYKVALGRTVLRRWVTHAPSPLTAGAASETYSSDVADAERINLIQSCFMAWRRQVPPRAPRAVVSPAPYASSAPPSLPTHRGDLGLSHEEHISTTDQQVSMTADRTDNLVTAKPRIPLHLLHASPAPAAAATKGHIHAPPYKKRINHPSAGFTQSDSIQYRHNIHDKYLSMAEAPLSSGPAHHFSTAAPVSAASGQQPPPPERNDQITPLVISELEKTILEMESSAHYLLKTSVSSGEDNMTTSMRHIEQRRKLAHYLKQYADEIDQLHASRSL